MHVYWALASRSIYSHLPKKRDSKMESFRGQVIGTRVSWFPACRSKLLVGGAALSSGPVTLRSHTGKCGLEFNTRP